MNIHSKMRALAVLLLTGLLLFPAAAYGAGEPAKAETPPPAAMFDLYEQNRKQGVGNYITEDFIILAAEMAMNQSLTKLERDVLLPELTGLVQGLLEKFEAAAKAAQAEPAKPEKAEKPEPAKPEAEKAEAAKPGKAEPAKKEKAEAAKPEPEKAEAAKPDTGKSLEAEALKANLELMRLLLALLKGEDKLDSKLAAEELALVLKAEGIAVSKLCGQKIDYTQFKPRGRYAESPETSAYYRAVKYMGTMFFPVKQSKATGVDAALADRLTMQAMLIARSLSKNKELERANDLIDARLAKLVGPSEDLAPADYLEIAGKMKDKPVSEIRAALLDKAKKENRLPRIISAAIDKKALEKGVEPREVLVGLRLLPQRYTPDSAVFQALVYDNVTDYTGKGNPFTAAMINGKKVKGYPLGLELMALLGSKDADAALDKTGERSYKNYKQARAQAAKILTQAEGLASERMAMMQYWLTKGGGDSDPARRLNTCLAMWTYNRYTNQLYAKQSYTLGGKGLNMNPDRKAARIAPAVELYMHLASLVRSFDKGLGDKRLAMLAEVLDKCRELALKTRKEAALSPPEIEYLNGLDLTLLKVTGEKDRPVVVDVHTEPTGAMVLEEGLGFAKPVEYKQDKTALRGALFSYYEFKQPMDKRLTDEEWAKILDDPAAMKKIEFSPGSAKE